MSKIVAIIPARGGSKGIPRKNLIELNGHPLIYYTIKSSLNSKVDETWVSSEDEGILRVSKEFGAKIIKRPVELATDTASSESVLLHFANIVDFDILVFLQATSPLTIAEDINNAIKMLKDYDSVMSVSELTQFIWKEGKPTYDINDRKMRQELNPSFIETGALYVTTRKNLLKYKNRIGGKIGFYVIPKIRSFEIDSYEDLELIKKIMK